MNSCMQSQEIKASRYFIYFLTVQEESKWKVKKKEAEAQKHSNNLKDTARLTERCLESSIASLHLFSACWKSIRSSGTSLNVLQKWSTSQSLYTKSNLSAIASNIAVGRMRKLSKQLLIDFDQSANTIFNLSECFAQLYKISETYKRTHSSRQGSFLLQPDGWHSL